MTLACCLYPSEYSFPQLSGSQLDIAGKVITVFVQIKELTKAVSAESSCLSLVIPCVRPHISFSMFRVTHSHTIWNYLE